MFFHMRKKRRTKPFGNEVLMLSLQALYVGSTLKFSLEQRHDVISTTFQRCSNVRCPLGWHDFSSYWLIYISKKVICQLTCQFQKKDIMSLKMFSYRSGTLYYKGDLVESNQCNIFGYDYRIKL